MKNGEKIQSQINKLEEKYKNSGQDLSSYLDGLLYQRYLTYWDYIHLDTLLSIQVPRTHFPDEEIFIMYHQITELYFKLILHEQKQIVEINFKPRHFSTTIMKNLVRIEKNLSMETYRIYTHLSISYYP